MVTNTDIARAKAVKSLALLATVATLGCGGSTLADTGSPVGDHPDATAYDAGHTATLCIPGQSVACTGPGGCSSSQACSASGNGFGACACAPPSTVVCVPGKAIACAGPGGCISSQVCNADGKSYGACSCGADGGASLSCIPGQSIACGGPYGCPSNQVCNDAGNAYGPCDCPDASSYLNDAGELPDGYAPIPPSLGHQGYNAIWAVNPLDTPSQGWIFRPFFSPPDCAAVPPFGDAYAAIFSPITAGPTGTFPSCSQPGGGPMPCYETQIYTYATGDNSFQTVPGGKLTLSSFNSDGIATGQMDTPQGIIPLIVKACD
jgi:hypothetical protein